MLVLYGNEQELSARCLPADDICKHDLTLRPMVQYQVDACYYATHLQYLPREVISFRITVNYITTSRAMGHKELLNSDTTL
jgi:hypothetical protein